MLNRGKNQRLPKLENPASALLVVAPYYREITDQLVTGASEILNNNNITFETIEVPGALEIPAAINFAAKTKFDGFVALGCVIRGETSHYETVAFDSSRAISQLALRGLCIGNGILTVENYPQAVVRADIKQQNKGGGAAKALIHLLAIKEKFA